MKQTELREVISNFLYLTDFFNEECLEDSINEIIEWLDEHGFPDDCTSIRQRIVYLIGWLNEILDSKLLNE